MVSPIQDAVDLLQTALASVHDRTQNALGLKLTKAEVELELEAVKTAGANIEFKVFGLGGSAGATGTWSRKHSVKLELTPKPTAKPLALRSESDELADAIIALAADAKAVRGQVAKDFALGPIILTVTFGFTKEGKAAVIVGGSASDANSHAITLTFDAA